jgi:hypothetical protein
MHEQRRVISEGLVFHFFASITGLAMTVAATALGFWQARRFTVNRLQYVDAVQNGLAPVLAGVGAAIVAIPVVMFVPLVGTGTALLFGLSVALGVSSGARDIRKRLGAG